MVLIEPPSILSLENPLDLNRLDSWLRAMRNPAEAVETLQPEILHVPINSSKASVLPEQTGPKCMQV